MTNIAMAEPAVGTYDRLAPYYDEFTAGYAHEKWIAAIEEQATELGLRGRRALDIGCGTGASTAPLRALGYQVSACDISPEMVRIAREKFHEHARSFFIADMRALPPLGEFDLVLCLDDCVNYLLSDGDLEAAFRCVARLLAPGGVFAFDVNSLRTYRSGFTDCMVRESAGHFFSWQGEAEPGIGSCGLAAATLEVFAERADGLWERHSSRHVQRHHSRGVIAATLGVAGLSCCRVLGQLAGARLEARPSEERHSKLLYFARRAFAETLSAVDNHAK